MQTFVKDGDTFTVIANHFKSKSDSVPPQSGNDNEDIGDGPDVIMGLGGDDVIRGGNADDVICGGAGNDVLSGDNAADVLLGGFGDDVLSGRQRRRRVDRRTRR